MEPSLSDSYRARITDAIITINATYPAYQAFLYALKDVPGSHGIDDVLVAQDAISNITDHERSILNLSVIVRAGKGINIADARSRVTEALDGYAAENTHRVTYEFRTFDDYHSPDGTRRGALTSIRELARCYAEFLEHPISDRSSAPAEGDEHDPYKEPRNGFEETKPPERSLERLIALGS